MRGEERDRGVMGKWKIGVEMIRGGGVLKDEDGSED